MSGWNHANAVWEKKTCPVCNTEFSPNSGAHKFCSAKCKGKWKYITGVMTTESQYKLISGNWRRYASRLMYYGGRKRDKLSVEIVLAQLEKQNYLCALSGVPLTCQLERGVVSPTNASVDRVVAGGPYTADNIQIVCRALNNWRSDTSVPDFVEWCRKVVEHHERTLSDVQGEKENDHGKST